MPYHLTIAGSASEYTIWSSAPRTAISAFLGAAYFFVGIAGGRNLLIYEHGVPWFVYTVSIIAALAKAASIDKALQIHIKRLPRYQYVINIIAVIGGLSGLTYYTGGRFGALLMDINRITAESLAAVCFICQFYICSLSILLCRDKVIESAVAITNRDKAEILRMLGTLVIGAMIALFTTDSFLAAIQDIASAWFKVDALNHHSIANGLTAALSITGFPVHCIWTQIGLQKLTYGSKKAGVSVAPDLYTFIAVPISALLFLLSTLGSASSPNGEVFTAWVGFKAAFALKITFLLLYSILAPLNGVEALLKTGHRTVKSVCSFCFTKKEVLTVEPLPVINTASLAV